MDFIHCGDTQGDVIRSSIEDITPRHDWLSVRIKKDREQSESGVFVAPNLVIRSAIDEKMAGILKAIGEHQNGNETGFAEAAAAIDTPVFLKLYISTHCPHCPKAAINLGALTTLSPSIHLEIIDGLLYNDKSEKDRIRSVPTLILDDNHRWVGDIHVRDVMEVITQRDPEQLSDRAIRNMIEAGRASYVAELMIGKGRVFKALIDLVLHEKWSVRLGAMVVAEEAGAADENLGRGIMDRLWSAYDRAEDTIRGDIVYLAGEIGSAEDRAKLLLLEHENKGTELGDAVQEALDTLNQRLG